MYCMNSMQLRYWEYKTVGQIGDPGHAMVRDTHRKKDFPQEKSFFSFRILTEVVCSKSSSPAADYSCQRCCCP